MVVEQNSAPVGASVDRRRGGPGAPLRRTSLAAIVLGVALIVAAGVWALVAPGQLVKYDTSDQTAIADGKFSLYVDAATGLPLTSPQVAPLHVEQLLHIADMQGGNAVVSERDTQVIAGQTQVYAQQYIVDRGSLQSVKGDLSWAYTSGNVVDRSPAYTVNLPFNTGSGPYAIWMNEAGKSYPFSQDGSPFTNDGVTVVRLRGHLDATPVPAYYVAALKPSGIPDSVTFDQLKSQLKAAGFNVDALIQALLPKLSASELGSLQAASAQPIKLDYFMTADTSILVEQRTGAIVSLEKQDETLTTQPDPAGLGALGAILTAHADVPAVQQALPALATLAAAPPSKVFNATYTQTPASVQQITDYVNGQGNRIDLVKTYLPVALLVVGLVLVAAGGGVRLANRRRQRATIVR